MTNWRELGEVPDSDDDGLDNLDDFDSQDRVLVDADDIAKSILLADEPQKSPVENTDIWSVSDSSPVRPRFSAKTDPRPKLSEALPLQEDAPEPHFIGAHDLPVGEVALPNEPPAPIESPRRGDVVSTSDLRSVLPPLLSSPLSSPPILKETSPTPSAPSGPSPSRSTVSTERRERDDEGLEISRQTAVQLERSLRPRKPIQQHPYLLENAQYAQFMKSHGVRPIKITVEAESASKKAQEEDSQGEDYEAEESQDRPGETEESAPLLFDGPDELAPSPSPPRTSPAGNPLRPSSQLADWDQTPLTRFSDDDDLPTLQQLIHEPASFRVRRLKRKSSQLLSSRRKRPNQLPSSSQVSSPPRQLRQPPSIWDLSSSPSVSPAQHNVQSEILGTTSPVGERQKSTPGSSSSALPASIRRPSAARRTPILIEDGGDDSDSDSAPSTSSAASESDIIRQNSRRIRGVLPASWLRLDKQTHTGVSGNARKSPDPAPTPLPKRGVAIPKQTTANRVNATQFLFDEADDSDDEPARDPARVASLPPTTPVIVIHEDDDAASVVEEDWIDPMLSGRKRASSPSVAQKTKRRKKDNMFDRPGKPQKPRITEVLGRSMSKGVMADLKNYPRKGKRGERTGASTKQKSRQMPSTPPLLSILDVIEPEAPQFLKIAARAVRKKTNLGRASPSKKVISLANRTDNVEALSALRDWKSGKMRQRAAISTPRQREASRVRPALQSVSSNPRPQPVKPRGRPASSFPQKLTRQGNLNGFVAIEGGNTRKPLSSPSAVPVRKRRALHDSRPVFYPAQLETEDTRLNQRRLSLHTRALDAFYQSRNVAPSAAGLPDQIPILNPPSPLQPRQRRTDEYSSPKRAAVKEVGEKANAKSRFRKKLRPRHVDLAAPQYTHANDPLPVETVSVEEIEELQPQPQPQEKIRGLGPYGTQYTHHFEVFPLDRGSFFHESTIIGSGLVRRAVDMELSSKLRCHRPTISFVLDGQTLRWGVWDDKTSSELGILVDWITEKISPETPGAIENADNTAIEAADFVLRYILDSLSVPDDDVEAVFVARSLDVFSGLVDRLELQEWENTPTRLKRMQLEVGVYFCVVAMALRSLSRSSRDVSAQSLKVETLVRRCASATITGLLSCGLEELRALYDDLQRLSFRERGIRSDQRLANWWVVMIRILENANIPKGSFWDITHSVMVTPAVACGSDAQVFERLWQDMFLLLPLGEVDDDGVVILGSRKTKPLDGWMLPQRLMKRVFHLYKSKVRQPPSFNEYCRALVARCHFLVQLWGWRMTSTAIGTIFDFFGSRELTNLRNEEVYKSPRFLEELRANPSLLIEPEDRCFHIFLKLVALSIRHLTHLERRNDIKNVIARVMPAHGRQYLKENTIDQRDLAGLRNHHDLLCTLFWVAPPDLRPGLHLIENLVIPGKAHKEATLINLRAWIQLARFVISGSEGAILEFRPFVVWGNNVFNQVMDQYLSAASDIEQQFRMLSSEMPGISTTVRDQMIAKNKASAVDVLHFSVTASLDVLRQAASFEATASALNVNQLQKIFTSLDFDSPGFDWGVVQVALETVDYFFGELDKVSEEQYSSGLSNKVDPQHIEDAALLFHEKLAREFFWMARKIIGLPSKNVGKPGGEAACMDRAVTLGAGIAARFVKDGLTPLSAYFSPGKYCLFSSLPKDMTTTERKYLPLFIAILVKNSVFDFRSLETSLLGIWLLCITKPSLYFGYESYLADVLKRHGIDFMQRATVLANVTADYNSNVDMFSCAMHHMRKKLRETESGQDRKEFRTDYDKILQLVMHRMKADLSLLRPDGAEHAAYVDFVRQIISLIKSYGVNICVVDPFFTRPGPDYSPPVQDPELHMATIIAYGIRLGEKETRAVPQLFYYLYNNFKVALGNGKLEQERRTMARAMEREASILSYVLEHMLPAVVLALQQVSEAWLLLELYTGALGDVLTGKCISKELAREDVQHAVGLLRSVLAWFAALRDREICIRQVHVMELLAGLVDDLQPSLRTYLYAEPEDGRGEVEKEVEAMWRFLEGARGKVGSVLALSEEEFGLGRIDAEVLLGGLPQEYGETGNMRIREFVPAIVADVKKTWAVTEERVMVQMAAGRMASLSGTQTGQGTRYGPWRARELLQRYWTLAGRWKLRGPQEAEPRGRQRVRSKRPAVFGEMLF